MTQEEIEKVLARAQEIQNSPNGTFDHDELVKSAEEAGISRNAVLQALRERIGFAEDPLSPGDFVFALSVDGDKHVAEFVEQKDNIVTVKFMNGAEAKLLPSAIQPLRMLPGERVDCEWSKKGWVKCSIEEYKPENKWVYVVGPHNDKRYFNLDEIRLIGDESKFAPHPENPWPARLPYIVYTLGGAIVGALLTWLASH